MSTRWLLLAHLAKGNVSFYHHLAPVVCRLSSVYFSHFNLLRTRGEHANHYATDAVPYFYLFLINLFNQNFLLSFNILFENKN
jgi:hypothetical protein